MSMLILVLLHVFAQIRRGRRSRRTRLVGCLREFKVLSTAERHLMTMKKKKMMMMTTMVLTMVMMVIIMKVMMLISDDDNGDDKGDKAKILHRRTIKTTM